MRLDYHTSRTRPEERDRQRPQYYPDVEICWVLRNHMLRFFKTFLNCKSFSWSKTLSASSVSSSMIKFSVCSFPLNNFLLHFFYYFTSVHLAPSSGRKSQLIFIILFYKKLSLYLKHSLKIYVVKYRYLVSMYRYNIVTQNITILWQIFFPLHCPNPQSYLIIIKYKFVW